MGLGLKSRRRLLILVGIFAAVLVAIIVAWRVREGVLDTRAKDALAEAGERAEKGQWSGAVAKYRFYLKRFPNDPEVLRAMVRAVAENPRAGPRALAEAAKDLRRALSLRPDLPGARRELMDLLWRAGQHREALSVAEDFLARDASDAEALRIAAMSAAELDEHARALEFGERYLALRPKDLEAWLRQLDAFSATRPPSSEIVDWAREAAAKNGESEDFRLLMAWALLYANRGSEARAAALALTAAPIRDAYYAERLIRLLDLLGETVASTEIMVKAAGALTDERLANALILRLFEQKKYEQLTALISAGTADYSVDSRGLRALSLAAMSRHDEAAAELKWIESQREDPTSMAWTPLLTAWIRQSGPKALSERIRGARTAVKRYPENAVFHFLLGNVYAEAGEAHLAIGEWSEASRRNPAWGAPALRAALLLARNGSPSLARELLQIAVDRSGESLEQLEAEILIGRGGFARMSAEERAGYLKRLEAAPPELRPHTLPIEAAILAATGRPEEAVEAVRRGLAANPPLPAATLVGLAEIARGFQLGVAEEVFARCVAIHGECFDVAAYRATRALAEDRPEEAVRLLRGAYEAGTHPMAGPALADLLDRLGDPEALVLWKSLVKNRPFDPSLLAIAATAKCAPPDFVQTCATDLKEITGEEGLQWRLLTARALTAPADPKTGDLTKAAQLLTEVLATAPQFTDVRLQLGRLYERLGNDDAAIRELTRGAQSSDIPPSVRVELARLLMKKGDHAGARAQLDRFLALESGSSQTLEQAAVMLALYGESGRALNTLERIATDEAEAAPRRGILLIRLLAAAGRHEEVRERLGELLVDPTLDAVLFAIEYYVRNRRLDEADRWLAELARFDIEPEILATAHGDYYRATGRPDEARSNYRRALEMAPENQWTWRRLYALELALGNDAEFLAAISEAGDRGPEDLSGQSDLLRSALGRPGERAIVFEWVDHPELAGPSGEVLTLCRKLAEARAPAAERAAAVRPLAEANPRYWTLRRLLLDYYVAAEAWRSALDYARQSVTAIPEVPGPREYLARLLLERGVLDDALIHARQWQRMSGVSPLASAKLIARIQLETGAGKSALEALSPHLALLDQPESADPELVLLAGRTWVAVGQTARASELFGRLAGSSREWALLSADFAVRHLAGAQEAAAWIERAEAALPAPSANELVGLARVWSECHERFGRAEDLARADAAFRTARERDDLDAVLLTAIAMHEEDQGRRTEAEETLRRALKADPNAVTARNNLAMLLAASGRAEEAIPIVRDLVKAFPREPEFRDTAASVLRAAKRYPEAIEDLKAAEALEPANIRWKIALADVLYEIGRETDARTYHFAAREAHRSGQAVPEVCAAAWQTIEKRLK